MNAPALSCEVCKASGPACGPCSVAPEGEPLRPCVRCGRATNVISPCGASRHYDCVTWSTVKPPPEDRPVCPNHGPEEICPDCTGPVINGPAQVTTEPEPVNDGWEVKRAQRERTIARLDAEQPHLRDELILAGIAADTVGKAVRLWNELMRGITYSGGHRTALGLLNGAFKHRGVPDLPEPHPDELVAPGDGPVWGARSWTIHTHHAPQAGDKPDALERANWAAAAGYDFAGFDINGMYLSAAASELGTGQPEYEAWPDVEALVKRPGWMRVSTLEGAPWSIADRWVEGMWLRTELVGYLLDAGAQFLVPEAKTQPNHRRWLDPHVDLLRAARGALVDADTPEAAALLPIVKDLYTRMFGGLLESARHNESRTLRPWWKAGIVGTGQSRMFRGLDKVPTGTVMAVGLHVDAAWFVMPREWKIPPGLEISPKLGKWKPAGRSRWTPELAAAYGRHEPKPLWRALHTTEPAGA